MRHTSMRFALFGTPQPAMEILDILHAQGFTPALIVTNPDKPQGRDLKLLPSPVKLWALAHNIPYLQPEKLDSSFTLQLSTFNFQLFVVVAYGAILPKALLNIPKHGSLNIHYSLLPKYRGATPVESQILADDKDTGVSILLLDEEMDHGPIIAQAKVPTISWPPTAPELRKRSNEVAGELLAKILPDWIAGRIQAMPQDHAKATYTRKVTSEDRHIQLENDPYKNFLKIQAFAAWGTYFFVEKGGKKVRVGIKAAEFKDLPASRGQAGGKLHITRVIPEGKKEMSYDEFLRGLR